jgi:hypothetical protein
MKFADFKHDGKTYKVEVSGTGSFGTVIDHDPIQAESYEKLKEKIVRLTRRASVRLALPATYAQGRSRWRDDTSSVALVDIVITGIHRQNRDILARTVGGTEEALRLIGGQGEILHRLTNAQAEQYMLLLKARNDSRKAFEAYEKKYHYTLNEIEGAVEKTEKDAGIEPERKEARR